MRHAIIVRDLSLSNVVFQHKDGKVKAYMVDGFGNSDILPLVAHSERLARAKILRKVKRTFGFLDYQWMPTPFQHKDIDLRHDSIVKAIKINERKVT